MKAEELFSITDSFLFRTYFSGESRPWTWVPKIKEALSSDYFSPNQQDTEFIAKGVVIEGSVYLDPTVKIGPNVVIHGPAYIGARTQIRPGAYIRGNVIVGEDCVLGNSCEFKNALLLNNVQVPHFSYVGDSILGSGSHLGAGVICSNLRLDQTDVRIKLPDGMIDTGLKKLGALIGDGAEVGCNSVLNPGSILGKRSLVYPATVFGGVLPSESIAASKQELKIINRR